MKCLILSFAIYIACITQVNATHIVGGDFSYIHVSGDQYKLKLKMYRDCTGSQFDNFANIGIFDKETDELITTLRFVNPVIYNINFNTSCIDPELRCVQTAVYSGTFTMSREKFHNTAGYYVEWERCCRNRIIKNIRRPEDASMAFYMEIPSPYPGNSTEQFINSSPEFTRDPLNYLCVGDQFYYDFFTKDTDGDIMKFSITDPLQGSMVGPGNPIVDNFETPSPGPYPIIEWRNTYGPSTGNYMDGAPDLAVDENTGIVTIIPQEIGVYVISILCEEFRNNVKIGETRRELQLEVIVCPPRHNPEITMVSMNDTVEVLVDSLSCFKIHCSDSDLIETMKLRFANVSDNNAFDFGAQINPTDISGKISLDAQICWTPPCDLDTSRIYSASIIVYDNGCPFPREDTTAIYFKIKKKPNSKPVLISNLVNNKITINPTTEGCFRLFGNDIDGDLIKLFPDLSNPIFANGASFPNITTGTAVPINAEFCWTPPCTGIDYTHPLKVEFYLADQSLCSAESIDTVVVEITVPPPSNNNPEVFASSSAQTKIVGDSVAFVIGKENCFYVTGSDDDVLDDINVYAKTGAIDVFSMGASFTALPETFVPGSQTYEFCWTPDCSAIQAFDSDIRFLIRDNKCANEKFDTISLKLKIEQEINNLPQIEQPFKNSYVLQAGYPVTIDVIGTDIDETDEIFLSAESELMGNGGSIRADFNAVNGYSRLTSQLSVFADCDIDARRTYNLRLLIRDKKCNSEDTTYKDITFTIEPMAPGAQPLVPDAFSPNNDGRNDVFKAYAVEQTICPENFSINIYDRWGKNVYESSDPKFEWDGENTVTGAYVYVIKYGKKSKSGFIAVIK